MGSASQIQEISPFARIQEHHIGNGTYSFTFTAQSSETRFRIVGWDEDGSGTQQIYLDHISIYEIRDTSYNDTMFLATSNGYRYGFNGMFKDDEWNGVGNSYDFGARMLDVRSGRWLARDPLEKEYPELSSYHYAGNNPVYNIDVEGKYFTGNTQKIVDLYAAVSALSNNNEDNNILKDFKATLERMDKSDIEFHIQYETVETKMSSTGGHTKFDMEKNRVQITVKDFVNDPDQLDKRAALAHELEHGRQFMDGELSFYQVDKEKDLAEGLNKKYQPGGAYDYTDELKAITLQHEIANKLDPLNREENEDLLKNQKNKYIKDFDGDESSYDSKEPLANPRFINSAKYEATDDQQEEKSEILNSSDE